MGLVATAQAAVHEPDAIGWIPAMIGRLVAPVSHAVSRQAQIVDRAVEYARRTIPH
jgi:hypothetical protein